MRQNPLCTYCVGLSLSLLPMSALGRRSLGTSVGPLPLLELGGRVGRGLGTAHHSHTYQRTRVSVRDPRRCVLGVNLDVP
ncbi:hypothetical protein PR003_g25261 [Phytophthora rubi]|uniref:Secreted protein n=2 Tax=Phytophthora TaxID=4783 RepID=A0A6A3IHV5_9STRA|nr:hypothetical protein PR002_g24340 [Phytophthora rubi]KAE8981730.1 hypothetical protein PR001_g23916 [Phytophthora rubi]KAE9250148.1 hypothetical protein PF004_g3077 [Phytophthora fragariae]KAE9290550.1 hypothetical protein PR003_g25261 [Phytophthora rubi]